jgi:hypothetical protein
MATSACDSLQMQTLCHTSSPAWLQPSSNQQLKLEFKPTISNTRTHWLAEDPVADGPHLHQMQCVRHRQEVARSIPAWAMWLWIIYFLLRTRCVGPSRFVCVCARLALQSPMNKLKQGSVADGLILYQI